MTEQNSYEGDPTCEQSQVIPSVGLNKRLALPSGNIWLCLQNNNNNAYYLSLADGNSNNNNKNNTYNVVLVEPKEVAELVFVAEEDCWSNKHSSWDAAKYHYHMGKRVFAFINALSDGSYKPWKSICFIVLLPKPREVFAAHYQDRITHHIVAPYMIAVAEAVHKANGNVSFGNRKGVSAWHACLRIQQLMREHPNGYIATFDIKGFFMSIDKNTAWEIFCRFEEMYRPEGYSDNMRVFLMGLIRQMIMHDPSLNCERHSPIELWDLVPAIKSLFYMHGIPIGNYYAQIIANLILSIVCHAILEYNPTEFVDDFAAVVDTIEELRSCRVKMKQATESIRLTLHPTKQYVQPVRHGVSWCGYTIYPNRMYVNNRPIHNCFWKLKTVYSEPSIYNARRLVQVLNSYTGSMCHCAEYNTQIAIRDEVMKFGYGQYLECRMKPNHIVFRVRKEYTRRNISLADIAGIENSLTHKKKKNHDCNADSCRLETLRKGSR